jgi:hypothetical protein
MKVELTDEDNKNLQEIVDSINVTIKDDLLHIDLDCYVDSILFEDGETTLSLSTLDGKEMLSIKLSILRNEIWEKIFTIFIRDLKLKLIYTE